MYGAMDYNSQKQKDASRNFPFHVQAFTQGDGGQCAGSAHQSKLTEDKAKECLRSEVRGRRLPAAGGQRLVTPQIL